MRHQKPLIQFLNDTSTGKNTLQPHPNPPARKVMLEVDSLRSISLMQTPKEASISGEADVKVQFPTTPDLLPYSNYGTNSSREIDL